MKRNDNAKKNSLKSDSLENITVKSFKISTSLNLNGSKILYKLDLDNQVTMVEAIGRTAVKIV